MHLLSPQSGGHLKKRNKIKNCLEAFVNRRYFYVNSALGVFLYLGLLGVGVNWEACLGFVRVFVECTHFDVHVS